MMSKYFHTTFASRFSEKLSQLIGDSLDEYISANRFKSQGTALRVLVALSGGPDSVALLHLMHTSADAAHLRVYAAHVNYGLRGRDSDRDEEFCRELCRELGITLYVKKVKTRGIVRRGAVPAPERKSSNLQQWAREVRYSFFEDLCDKHKIDFVATGHNKTDNVETIIMNLCRGAGSFGLSGIEPREGKIIRPLLNNNREEILGYLASNKLKYRIDRSNLEAKYTRNKVRQKLLPALESIFGESALDNIHRGAEVFREHKQHLLSEAERLLRRDATVTWRGKIILDLDRFREYDVLMQRITAALCFERLTGSLTEFDFAASNRVVEMMKSEIDTVDLKRGIFAEKAGKSLYFFGTATSPRVYAVNADGETVLEEFGMIITAEVRKVDQAKPNKLKAGKNLRVYLDADCLRGKLTARAFRRGDRFTPLGMINQKKLSDFYIDRKVDRPLREDIPLLLSGREIVWVIGHEISDSVKVTGSTKKILRLEVKPYRSV